MQDKRVTVPTWSHQLIVSVLSIDCSLTSARTGRAFCFLHHSCVHLIWSELMVLKSSGVQCLALVALLCAHSSGSCLALLSETWRASSHPACFFRRTITDARPHFILYVATSGFNQWQRCFWLTLFWMHVVWNRNTTFCGSDLRDTHLSLTGCGQGCKAGGFNSKWVLPTALCLKLYLAYTLRIAWNTTRCHFTLSREFDCWPQNVFSVKLKVDCHARFACVLKLVCQFR